LAKAIQAVRKPLDGVVNPAEEPLHALGGALGLPLNRLNVLHGLRTVDRDLAENREDVHAERPPFRSVSGDLIHPALAMCSSLSRLASSGDRSGCPVPRW